MGIQKITKVEEPKIITPLDVDEVISLIEKNKDGMDFLQTGFERLDDNLDGGFLRKELIVIGAHTGVGKSYVAGQLMMNIAKQGFKCAYFSLEISNEMVVARMIGAIANVKPTRIRMGLLTPAEYHEKMRAKVDLTAFSKFLFFYDTVYELKDIVNEIKTKGFDFVVVDFIQNVYTEGNDEYSRLSKVAFELQNTAKEANCTILTLSQLSNATAREGSKGKVLEYKGSGSIATVCDLGFFIERGEGDFTDGLASVKLSLRKNRRGNSGQEWLLTFRIPGGYIYEAYNPT